MFRRIFYLTFKGFMIIFLLTQMGFAANKISFDPEGTKITGSIKYTVIGRYHSQFDQFEGLIGLNDQNNKIVSVYLEIDAGTIHSKCGWCDKIVRSEQLLDTVQYPKIIFRSSDIFEKDGQYQVRGMLNMHGIQKEVVFPFEYDITQENGLKGFLDVRGKWVIDRKDFGIVWNKILDKGGILVGNDITVEWGIQKNLTML